mmetsp:Transcript_17282/g.45737  ORF Transcript_17282/g.45737 Transcript_17282/m.45737 type:complete len:204 (-) Transcript_17282:78-689(-)
MAVPVAMTRCLCAAHTARPTSSGVPSRASGVPSICACRNSGDTVLWAYSPGTHPGDTDSTRTRGASARPRERVIESTAALLAQYATLEPTPVTPATLEMLTTVPPPLSSSSRLNALTQAKEPRKLVDMILSIHSSVSPSRSSCSTPVVQPALLTRRSSRPSVLPSSSAAARRLWLSSVSANSAVWPLPGRDPASSRAFAGSDL